MFPYPSARFAAALLYSHNVAIKMEIWQSGATAPSFTLVQVDDMFSTTAPLVLVDGSVTYDKTSDQRGQCTVTVVSPDGSMVPKLPTDLITPWGNEIRLYRGIYYPPQNVFVPSSPNTIPAILNQSGIVIPSFVDGIWEAGELVNGGLRIEGSLTYDGVVSVVDDYSEYVPLGVFRMSKVEIDDQSGVPKMTITGYDRSRNVSRNVVQYYWPDFNTQSLILNQPWANMIQVALSDRWSPIQFDGTVTEWTALQNDPTNQTIPNFLQSFSEGSDLFDQMRQYAQAAGCDLSMTRQGICSLYKDPNFVNMQSGSGPPVATFVEGATATFEEAKRTLDDSVAYNQVIVYGAGDILGVPLFTYPPNGTPAVDNDENSPTYIGVPTLDSSGNYSYSGGSAYGVVTHIVNNNLLTTIEMCQNFASLQLAIDIGSQEAVDLPASAVNPCIDVDDLVAVQRTRIGISASVGYVVSNTQIPLMATAKQTMSVREKRNLTFV
jgi:hypothetical protein